MQVGHCMCSLSSCIRKVAKGKTFARTFTFSNQHMCQCVAKINLCNKLQEPFVPLCPLHKLSFCWSPEYVQPDRRTLLKMNVGPY